MNNQHTFANLFKVAFVAALCLVCACAEEESISPKKVQHEVADSTQAGFTFTYETDWRNTIENNF